MNISVIIPTFERKDLLSHALASVFAQTHQPAEVIVVNDGSSDDTDHILSRYPQICYIKQKNKGVSAARNYGIKHAQGEWICFLDDDDIWQRKKLEEQCKFHSMYPDFMLSQTNEIWIRNGVRVNPMKKNKKYGGDIFVNSLPLCLITPSSVMMKKVLFDEVGLFDEELPVCEDYDLWLRITVRYPVGLIEQELVIKYGGHADQLSRKLHSMDRFRIKSLEKMTEEPLLDVNKRREVLKELVRKCIIYAKGCRKHNNEEDARLYFKKAEQYQQNSGT